MHYSKIDEIIEERKQQIEGDPALRLMEMAYEKQKKFIRQHYENTKYEDLESLAKVRSAFLAKARNNENAELYEDFDIEKVEKNDWTVRRFLKANDYDFEASLKQLGECMQWRREFGINRRTEEDLPVEFVQAAGVFPYHEDRDGRLVIYLRVKVNKKVPALAAFFRQFLVGVINRVDEAADVGGYTLFFDFSGVGLSNVDMDFLHFFISTLRNYYPQGLRLVIAYKLPWILRGLWSIVKRWLGPHQKLIQFANGSEEVKQFIAEENLPRYLGGTCTTNFIEAPKCCQPVANLAHLYGFTPEEVEKYKKIFAIHIEEAKQLAAA